MGLALSRAKRVASQPCDIAAPAIAFLLSRNCPYGSHVRRPEREADYFFGGNGMDSSFYSATFIGNDFLLNKMVTDDPAYFPIDHRLPVIVEEVIHNAFSSIEGITISVYGSDIKFRDSASHYISVMIESDGEYWDIRETIEKLTIDKKGLELVTFTSFEHQDWEIRNLAVQSFVEEAIDNACMEEQDEEKAKSVQTIYARTEWFMDEIRQLVRDRLHEAIGEIENA